MIVYVDSSVFVKAISKEYSFNSLKSAKIVSSELMRTECIRQIQNLDELEIKAPLLKNLEELITEVSLMEINRNVLSNAEMPFGKKIRTLDAIHIGSAILLRQFSREEVVILTHDKRMQEVATLTGFSVIE